MPNLSDDNSRRMRFDRLFLDLRGRRQEEQGVQTSVLSVGLFEGLTTLFRLLSALTEAHGVSERGTTAGSDSTLAATGARATLALAAPPARYNYDERVFYPTQSAKD